MGILTIERIGGLAGFGSAGSHLRSRGEIDIARLSTADQGAVNTLFLSGSAHAAPSTLRDGFTYRISRHGPHGLETIDVTEANVPVALAACVKDELI
jgi:hypothetical protein